MISELNNKVALMETIKPLDPITEFREAQLNLQNKKTDKFYRQDNHSYKNIVSVMV